MILSSITAPSDQHRALRRSGNVPVGRPIERARHNESLNLTRRFAARRIAQWRYAEVYYPGPFYSENVDRAFSFAVTGRSAPDERFMTKRGPRVGRYLIYGLLDPRDQSLRYVGKTHKRREFRLAEHISNANEGHRAPVYDWIRDLQSDGMQPEIFVLERVSADADWRLAEQRWISRCRVWPGTDLPYLHPPQTPKSVPVLINRVKLLNVRLGG